MARLKNDGKGRNGGGRQKGTPNGSTAKMREWLANFVNEQRAQIEKDWRLLEPGERLRLFEKLLQYTMPKMAAIESNIKIEKMSDAQIEQVIDTLNISDVREEEEE